MREIKTVTLLGANGTMGAGSAGILASFGEMKVHMLARSEEKAREGIEAAVESVRSGIIRDRLVPGTYDDLERCVAESDWVFELVAENYETKLPMNQRIAVARRPGTLVSTVSSGLSIEKLASVFDEDGKRHYYGTHFFNPPYKLVLCELISHAANDPAITRALGEFLEKRLVRHVIYCNDRPGFAGNRIGFQLMNEAAQMAEKHQDRGGIYWIDQMLSGYTGRAMSPLATADLVGLDVHRAIVDHIHAHTNDEAHDTFALPAYMKRLIETGRLGNKTGRGLYQREKSPEGKTVVRVYDMDKDDYVPPPTLDLSFKKAAAVLISESNYRGYAGLLKTAQGADADLVRYFIARYVGYSLSLIPDVTDLAGVDGAMGFGFNWVPASAWIDLLGGPDETSRFIEATGLPVPAHLSSIKHLRPNGPVYALQGRLDYRQLFRAS